MTIAEMEIQARADRDEIRRLKAEVERLREALEQIDRETRSASDVGLLRMGSIARVALRGGWK